MLECRSWRVCALEPPADAQLVALLRSLGARDALGALLLEGTVRDCPDAPGAWLPDTRAEVAAMRAAGKRVDLALGAGNGFGLSYACLDRQLEAGLEAGDELRSGPAGEGLRAF